MNKRGRHWRFTAGLLLGGGLVVGCGGSEGSASTQSPPAQQLPTQQAPQAAPAVVDVVRHYADLMARGTRLTTPASRRFAGMTPTEQPAGNASPDYSISLLLTMPTYEVGAFLDQQQRLVDVNIQTPRPPEDPNRLAKHVPHPPGRLLLLGELRRAFGPGTNPPEDESQDIIHFAYRPSSDARQLTIRAFLPQQTSTDSSIVNEIDIFIE